MIRKFSFFLSTALAGAILAPSAYAADEADSSATTEAEGASSGGLAEIVVTAQKRTESVQSVPITISAFGEAQLEASGVQNTLQLTSVVPGFKFNQTSGSGTPYLRGVGYNTATVGNESPVATYVDGVYIPNMGSNIISLKDVTRVEVLAGPQGTLFGRNASGGVIQIITRNPEHDPSIRADVGYGNYDTVEANAFGTTGLSDTLAVSATVHYKDQGDGWGRNLKRDTDRLKGDEFGARGKLLWTPDDKTEFLLGGFYYERNTDIGVSVSIPKGAKSVNGFSTFVGFYNTEEDSPVFLHAKQYSASLTAKRDLGWATLTNIASYQKFKVFVSQENDASPSPIFGITQDGRQKTVTEELQLSSSDDSKLKWIIGGFYMHDDSRLDINFSGSAFGAGLRTIATQITKSYSAFAQATAEVLPDLNFTGGLRYTSDIRSISGFLGAPANPAATPPQKRTWNRLTYRASLDYKLSRDVMVFAQYNRGFKAGVFNLSNARATPVDPEVLDAFEVGFKSLFFDRRLKFNLSAFYYDYKGTQVKSNVNGGNVLFNADSEVKGVDVSIEAQPVPELTLTAAFEYLDPKYTYFPNSFYSVQRPTGGNIITVGDAKGNLLVQASKYSGFVGASYRIPIDQGGLAFNANLAFFGKSYWDTDNRVVQPAYQVLNASLKWTSPSEKVDVTLWGNNLANAHYYANASGALATGDVFTPQPPRTYGVTLGMKM